jgi:gas vesicle protein
MEKNMQESNHQMNRILTISLFVLIGGLAGATSMLLFAPQSGKRTRAQIKNQSARLADQTSKTIKKAAEQVRVGTGKLTTGVSEKAGELKQLGQHKLVEQLDRVSAALDAGKSKVESV